VRKLFVKICGITSQQDADLASELGASAVGFIFWPGSARYIPPENAGAIARRLSGKVMKVGVFVDESIEQVARVLDQAGLDSAQLHGNESPDYCRALGGLDRFGARDKGWLIKAVGVNSQGAAPQVAGFDPDVLILLDAHDPSQHGGTGQTIDWNTAREMAFERPIILAGGLTPENVGLALSTVQPYGIDVSSGVESAPGVKDHGKLRKLFEALNG
jgi:phosphoribosylanthranilate isomerase